MKPNQYEIREKIWLYPGLASWHFITLPKQESIEIKQLFGNIGRGFGSLPVKVTIGKTSWNTSIFPDKKAGAYLLPIKLDIRKKEHLKVADLISCTIEIDI